MEDPELKAIVSKIYTQAFDKGYEAGLKTTHIAESEPEGSNVFDPDDINEDERAIWDHGYSEGLEDGQDTSTCKQGMVDAYNEGYTDGKEDGIEEMDEEVAGGCCAGVPESRRPTGLDTAKNEELTRLRKFRSETKMTAYEYGRERGMEEAEIKFAREHEALICALDKAHRLQYEHEENESLAYEDGRHDGVVAERNKFRTA